MPEFKSEICGYYKLEIVKSDGSKKIVADFPNLITDWGIANIYTGWYVYCHIGDGTTTPTYSDTSLSGYKASVVAYSGEAGGRKVPFYYYSIILKYKFNITGIISEVGIGPIGSNNSLFSRALILNALGKPTAITVASDEILYITYEFRSYPSLADITGIINIGGSYYNWTSRTAYNILAAYYGFEVIQNCPASLNLLWNAYSGIIGSIDGMPSGDCSPCTNQYTLSNTIIEGRYCNDYYIRWGTTKGNFSGGISAIAGVLVWVPFQIGFSPAIPKTSLNNLTFVLRHSHTRRVII